MNKAIVTFACFLALAGSPGGYGQDALKITPSELPTGDDPGFRCLFWQEKPELVFLWADDDTVPNRRALITVNGKRAMLAQTGLKRSVPGNENVGDLLEMTFEGAGIGVHVAATVTETCPSDSENCEVTHYRAKIVVTSGNASATISTEGDCGS